MEGERSPLQACAESWAKLGILNHNVQDRGATQKAQAAAVQAKAADG